MIEMCSSRSGHHSVAQMDLSRLQLRVQLLDYEQTEIVQQLKELKREVAPHHSEAYLLTIFFRNSLHCLVAYFHFFAVFNVLFNTFN